MNKAPSAQLIHQHRNASGLVELIEVMRSPGCHVTEVGSLFADFVEGLEGDFNPGFPGDGREVEGRVG